MATEREEDTVVGWHDGQDVLSALVRIVGLQGLVLSTMALGSPWRIRNARPADPVLHVVTTGLGYVSTPSSENPIELGPGDAVMLPSAEH